MWGAQVYPEGKMSQHLDKMTLGQSILAKGPKGRFEYTRNMKTHLGALNSVFRIGSITRPHTLYEGKEGCHVQASGTCNMKKHLGAQSRVPFAVPHMTSKCKAISVHLT